MVEIIEFLRENLSIDISEESDMYSDSVQITVSLKLGGEEISRDWFSIDNTQ